MKEWNICLRCSTHMHIMFYKILMLIVYACVINLMLKLLYNVYACVINLMLKLLYNILI